jgi:hypothetical protein
MVRWVKLPRSLVEPIFPLGKRHGHSQGAGGQGSFFDNGTFSRRRPNLAKAGGREDSRGPHANKIILRNAGEGRGQPNLQLQAATQRRCRQSTLIYCCFQLGLVGLSFSPKLSKIPIAPNSHTSSTNEMASRELSMPAGAIDAWGIHLVLSPWRPERGQQMRYQNPICTGHVGTHSGRVPKFGMMVALCTATLTLTAAVVLGMDV